MQILKIIFWTLMGLGALLGAIGIFVMMFFTALAIGFPFWFTTAVATLIVGGTAYVVIKTW